MFAKSYMLVIGAFCTWLLLTIQVGKPWLHRVEVGLLPILAVVSQVIWSCLLLWAIHHLAFQLGGFFLRKAAPPQTTEEEPHVAILYTTCDDFNSASCRSCLEQDYPHTRVLILDDSKSAKYRRLIRDFCYQHVSSRCELVRRPNNEGFKAGNLNWALEKVVTEDWFLLVDADQVLPPDYVSRLVAALPADASTAFVQTANREIINGESSHFQRILSLSIRLYSPLDLGARDRFGFVPLLGHSAIIRRSAWEEVGKFPHAVSEDYSFAMRSASKGHSGICLQAPFGYESLPYDFGGFILRLRKYAGGTAELFRKEALAFLRGRAHGVEKWDGLMQLGWYPLMPLMTLNGFLSAYVIHSLHRDGSPYLHVSLPGVYGLGLYATLCLYTALAGKITGVFQFYFWSTAVHAASTPLAGVSFMRHLFFDAPRFNRTPKNGEEEGICVRDSGFMVLLGLAAIFGAAKWSSPFAPVLAGQGVAYLSYPIYGKLCSPCFLGRIARTVVYIPGLLMLTALYATMRLTVL